MYPNSVEARFHPPPTHPHPLAPTPTPTPKCATQFPDHYLAIANLSSGAVGIEGPNPDVNDATWSFVAGLSPAPPNTTDSFTLVSQSKSAAWSGKLLTATTAHTSPCVYADPAGDVMLTDGTAFGAARATWVVGRMPPVPPAPTSYINVDASTVTNAAVSAKTMGCHHDCTYHTRNLSAPLSRAPNLCIRLPPHPHHHHHHHHHHPLCLSRLLRAGVVGLVEVMCVVCWCVWWR